MVSTFPEILLQHARDIPDKTAYRFLQGKDRVPETLSFGQVWSQSAALARHLRSAGLKGKRVLIVCKSQRYFVLAFYGCLLAGATAVPTALPRRQHLLSRLQLLASDSQAGAVVVDSDDIGGNVSAAHNLASFDMRILEAGLVAAGETPPRHIAAVDGSSLAFLQYTSGSTGRPKGVMVTHSNLIHNSEAIRQGMDLSSDSVVLSALPLFHDMGLVGGMLQSMYCGCEANILAPAEFVQYPERWLQHISSYRVTVSGGPNFMFQLAASTIKDDEIADVDLSSWRIAFCGAEPVRASTLTSFTNRFRPLGFQPESFFPCYGMAEATLYVTGKPPATAARVACAPQQLPVVACGVPRHGTQVAIVDPDTGRPLPEEAIGEIWVSGDSVAAGYWQQPILSEQQFGARLEGDSEARFLRTGDLGFLDHGQLYVTGRLKDLIILHGRNYAPHDIEEEAERCHPGLRKTGCAAFSISDAMQERVVLVAELTREFLRRPETWGDITAAVRQAVHATLQVPVGDVVLIRPGTLPRTSSGKIRRGATKDSFLAGALELAGAQNTVSDDASAAN